MLDEAALHLKVQNGMQILLTQNRKPVNEI